jgi:hypothetical protein
MMMKSSTLLGAIETEFTVNEDGRTGRAVTTATSRSVSMIFPTYNTNPVIDARRRW